MWFLKNSRKKWQIKIEVKKKKIKKEIRFKIKNYFYTFFKAHFTYFLSLLYKIESFKKKKY